MHEFSPTGPITLDGPTEITCSTCETPYTNEQIGDLDSLEWERQRAVITGDQFVEPRTTRYKDEEQFVEQFIENTEQK